MPPKRSNRSGTETNKVETAIIVQQIDAIYLQEGNSVNWWDRWKLIMMMITARLHRIYLRVPTILVMKIIFLMNEVTINFSISHIWRWWCWSQTVQLWWTCWSSFNFAKLWGLFLKNCVMLIITKEKIKKLEDNKMIWGEFFAWLGIWLLMGTTHFGDKMEF